MAAQAQAPRAVDSLRTLLDQAGSDTARARLTNKVGSAWFYTDMDSAMAWWGRALAMGETLAEDADSAIREKGQRVIMSSSNNLAVVAQYRGLYPLALRHHQRCIRIALALKDKRGLALSTNNIGIIKKDQLKLHDALAHFQASHRFAEQLQDTQMLASTLNNIGTAYLKLKQDSLALQYFQRSLVFSTAVGDQVQEVDNRINIGALLTDLGQPQEALPMLMRADSLAVAIEYEIGLPEARIGIARALQALGQHKAALDTMKHAIALSRSLDLTEVTITGLDHLAELEAAEGRHHDANRTLRSYIVLKDSVMNSEKLLEFGQLEASFSHEREEYEAKLAQEKAAAERRAQQFRQYITGFAALCGFVLLMLGAMRWVRRRAIRKMFIFAALLFFFEFLLVLIDSFIDGLTGGQPMPKLVANIAIAALIAPAHTLLERWLLRQKKGER